MSPQAPAVFVGAGAPAHPGAPGFQTRIELSLANLELYF